MHEYNKGAVMFVLICNGKSLTLSLKICHVSKSQILNFSLSFISRKHAIARF
jgi:hypothetical protein